MDRYDNYQVGILLNFSEDDPVVSDLDEAIQKAYALSLSKNEPAAVWASQEEGSELLYIVHQGSIFHK
ncbi:MAG: hypothetical protein GY832_20100 [Chloroflexi bacterium]|nr:hypothetical protein [Chloroflexota bacterium]